MTRARPAVCAAALAAALACRASPLPLPQIPGVVSRAPAYTEEDLHADLSVFAGRFSAIVTAAADEIAPPGAERVLRRRTLLWKLRMIPAARGLAFQPDAQRAYAASLTLAVQQRHYLTEGEGAALFGAEQQRAVEAARRLEEHVVQIGARFLDPADLDRIRTQVEALAREYPIRGIFSPETAQVALTQVDTGVSFRWLVDLPMVPFRTLGGVSEGAYAIAEFNETARRFGQVVADLPQQIRWQTELLLFDVETRDTVATALGSFETVAESSRRLAGAAERLPAEMEGPSRRVLADARAAVEAAGAALESARDLAGPLARTAEQLNQAGISWGETVRAFRAPDVRALRAPDQGDAAGGGAANGGAANGAAERGAGNGDGKTPSFDVRDVERAASEVRTAAEELRGLVVEVRGLLESDRARGALGEIRATVDAGAGDVVDTAAWRVLLLLVAFFVLLFGYRVLVARVLG